MTSIDDFACTLDGLTATAKDGRTAALDKCAWVEIAPCGCMAGITMAVNPDKILRTPEEAQRQLSGSAGEAKRDRSNGCRMLLVLMEDYRPSILEIFQLDCTHNPKWGVEKPTRTAGGVTFTRVSDRRWRAGDRNIEKYGYGWYLMPLGTGRSTFLATRLPEALSAAAAQITPTTDAIQPDRCP